MIHLNTYKGLLMTSRTVSSIDSADNESKCKIFPSPLYTSVSALKC